MSYTLKVRSGLPFSYHAKKSRFYNLDGFDTTLTDTTITDPMIAYQGLATSFDELDNLDTISFTGGELPDYSIANSIVKTYAPSGYTYWNCNANAYGNFNIIGNPSIDTSTGVISGFSSSDYITLGTFSPNGNTWEYYIKFTTGSSTSAQGLSTCVGSSDGCSPFYIDGGNLIAFLSSNGSSWNIASSETIMSISANTTYKMKAEYTGTEYNWYQWENDSWTLKKTITSSSAIYDGLTMLLGNNRGQNNPFGGTIDLSETYITIGGSTWWSPAGSKLYEKFGDGCMDSEWVDDGSAANYNVFYNANDGFFMNDADYISGSMWTGELNIPSHTVPTYLKQQWTTYGDIIINQQMKNTTNFYNKYVELDVGAFPENYEIIVKNTFYNTDSTPRWMLTNSGSNVSCYDMCCTDVAYFGCWNNGSFRHRGNVLTEGQNYWFRVRKANGFRYLYHIIDNNYTLNTLPSIDNWISDMITNDKYVYPDDPVDVLRLGNHSMNSLITSQYSYNTFFFDTFQLNELDLHNGKKRQILTMFDNTPHVWINDDGEQFVLNRNQNSTGDDGCKTNGEGLTGFTDTTSTCIISDYTFSYSSGSGSATPFEIVAHVKTGSSTTGTNRCIYSSGTSYPGGMYLVLLSNGCVEGCIHNNENNFKAITATALQPNTEYWIKVSNYAAGAFFPSPAYSIYLSTDGVNYTLEGTMPGTIPTQWTTTGNRTLVVGSQNGGSCFGAGGIIYSDGSYIKINGSTVWQLGINI